MTNVFYIPIKDIITFTNTKPEFGVFLCSKDTKLTRRDKYRLRQFELTGGHYMLSNDLLMVISIIFKIEYEDLWNLIFLRSDRSRKSDEEFFSTREEELVLHQSSIFKYDV